MRLSRGTVLLLILCFVVVMVVAFFQQPLLAVLTPPTPTVEVRQILPFNIAQQTTQFTIQRGEEFTTLARRDDGAWQVIEATNADEALTTNDELVDGILQIMGTLEYERTFDSDDLGQFGLDTSTSTIQLVTDDSDILLTIGDTNPDGDSLYLTLNDAPTVYIVPAVFEFSNIMRLANEPPYRDVIQVDDSLPDNLLFPDVFGYQIMEFRIQDMRDGSWIAYRQGEQGTWNLDGTVVNTDREVDHVQAAVNVSQFLFLEVEPLAQSVRESLTDLAILTLSMTTEDSRSYTMSVYTIEDIGYAGIVDDGTRQAGYMLPNDTVNLFFDMVVQPPYATS